MSKIRNDLDDLINQFDISQQAKADAGKPMLSLVPPEIIAAVGRVRTYGVAKYPHGGYDNWKQVDKQRYKDAMMRHLVSYLEDEDSVDDESCLSHLEHMACNVAFLLQLKKESRENADGS